ncbi:hypothetical protein ITP53_52860 [Nonomuraea sp. K274]|uniref:Uncharacterized protein n=1 Tax=Nonomuraea cypriaca TaxID=1187855 RepID=A0A931APJ4_9ACTN|nr:hypothetical protein [Nonomuraea cypriaca]MBF8194219.1 hypothetical protein [Nonomuraea cypriaca]
MIRLFPAAAAVALATAALPPLTAQAATAALSPLAAQAAPVPVYTCDTVRGDPGVTVLFGGCQATPGAVTNGDFTGQAIGQTRQTTLRIKCTGGGRASLPAEVLLKDCTQIG